MTLRALPCLMLLSLGLLGLTPLAHAAGVLPAEVDAALQRAHIPREALSALVLDLGDDGARTRLSWRAEQPMNPASLMKLLTTTAALDTLGPAWQWRTPVWLQGTLRANGVLDGDLVIQGQGDPKLVVERLWLLLHRVRQSGVREIHGDILLDRSAFRVPTPPPGEFDGEPSKPYNVGPDALMVNLKALVLTFTPDPGRGVVAISAEPPLAGVAVDATVPLADGACGDWRGALRAEVSDPQKVHFAGRYPAACGEQAWPLAYADPASFNARAVAGVWQEVGGSLSGKVRDGNAPTGLAPSFTVSSPPLAEVVRDINKYSNNVMAQQLFLTLGLTQRGQGTPEAAREWLQQWLADRLGEPGRAAVVDNGSGLSRQNRISAQLLGQLLTQNWQGATASELMSSLPVAGVDGTLRRSQAAAGRAHMKTGTLRDVTGMAGYVLTPSGKRLVVVGLINHPQAPTGRPALEALVQWASAEADRNAPAADAAPLKRSGGNSNRISAAAR
jgi:D-alanyl-D-alanine carboxypeptidase/D-alanyl-D-alanine-endopeptidase (penicillin-binding protein 4)